MNARSITNTKLPLSKPHDLPGSQAALRKIPQGQVGSQAAILPPVSQGLTYKDSGVDIDAGNEFVERIKKHTQSTHIPGVLSDIGFFGSFFAPDFSKYKKPILVSSTDGVGTKIKLAIELNIHHSIGIDLVAMSVNDLVVCGAQPLFFLDYIACHKLDPKQAERIVSGIAEGCRQAGCALVGGETAEMNDLYKVGDYDLAGFVTGIVDQDKIIDGKAIAAGDVVWALPSSGVHSNGYSLVRKVARQAGWNISEMADVLLRPTRVYVKDALALVAEAPVKGLAHITGGGLPEKAARIIPDGLKAVFYAERWPLPQIFEQLQRDGRISRDEMYRTFNMGLGLVAVLPKGITPSNPEWMNVGQIVKSDDAQKIKVA